MLEEALNQANKFNAAVNELASVVSELDGKCTLSIDGKVIGETIGPVQVSTGKEREAALQATVEKQRKLLVGYMKANANLSKRLADTEQEHIRVGYALKLDRLLHAAGIEIRVTGSTQGRCVEFDMRSKVMIEEKIAVREQPIARHCDPSDVFHNIETGRMVEIKTEPVHDMRIGEDVSLVMRVHQ